MPAPEVFHQLVAPVRDMARPPRGEAIVILERGSRRLTGSLERKIRVGWMSWIIAFGTTAE
jgi:hypothetical protein